MAKNWLALAFLALASCSSGGSTGDLGGPRDLAMLPDLAMGAVVVPDPGPQPIGADWFDTEPNDTPDKAVKVGTATANDVIGGDTIITWMGFNMATPSKIGGADVADYYVFNSGVATKFNCQICWSTTAQNLLDFTLYKVVDGMPLEEVAVSAETDTACENIVPKVFPMTMNTKYLLAVKSVTGSDNYTS